MSVRNWVVGFALLTALVVAGCGGGGSGQQGGGQQGGTGSATINVSEKEWTITFATASVKAGKLTFVIKNDGAIEHNFEIKGANVEVDAIQPGQTKEITADLKPGTYTVICNIPGHEEAGMKTTLTVSQ